MKKFLAIVLAAFMFLSLTPNAFAAAVGSQLLQPEEGWKRFDDNNTLIKLESSNPWTVGDNDPKILGKPFRYTTDPNAKVSFSFYGTKIRLIHRTYTTSRTAIVNIDGESEEYKLAELGNTFATLVFEKVGLPKKNHTVVITYIDNNNVSSTMDAVDIDEDGYLVDINKPINLNAIAGDAQNTLTWDAVADASSYTVNRSTTTGGPYEIIATSVTGTTYTDNKVVNGTTYYYVVASVKNAAVSSNSNEASATPQANPVTGDRALLTITMNTGLEKEYDLSMTTVNAFFDWYEARSNGMGSAKFAIDKGNNNKGPFSSRKDYIIFDKVLTFEVSEYTTK